jgi:hypothetical protein
MATMVAYSRRMSTDPVDAVGTGQYWSDRLDTMLTTLVHDRDRVRDLTCIDVRFDDFMADELDTAAQVIRLAGDVVSDCARDNMADYLEAHVRGRLGTIDYRAEDLGLDLDQLRTRFEPYSERFLV